MWCNGASADRIRFCEIAQPSLLKLAQHLDGNFEGNWRYLAEELGSSPSYAQWVACRAPGARMCSATLLFFDEYCEHAAITLGQLVRALHKIGNELCVTELANIYGSDLIRQALSSNTAVPDDTSIFGHQHTRSRSPSPNNELWESVKKIGDNFSVPPVSRDAYLAPEKYGPAYLAATGHNDYGDAVGMVDDRHSPVLLDLRAHRKRDYNTDRQDSPPNQFAATAEPLHVVRPNVTNNPVVRSEVQPNNAELKQRLPDENFQVVDRHQLSSLHAPTDAVKLSRTQEWLMDQNRAASLHGVGHLQSPADREGVDLKPSLSNMQCDSLPKIKDKTLDGLTPELSGGKVAHRMPPRSASEKHMKHLTDPVLKDDIQLVVDGVSSAHITNSGIMATLPDLQHSIFSQDNRRVRVFVTYVVDSKEHRKNVIRLCYCLKENGFSVSLDVREKHLLSTGNQLSQWYDMRYNAADYVLVLVSPLYKKVVDGTASSTDDEVIRNAVQIYKRMRSDMAKTSSRRFITVMMQGSTLSDIPSWLNDSTQHYMWPSQYVDLLYYMMRPANIVSEFVHRRGRELEMQRCLPLPGGRRCCSS